MVVLQQTGQIQLLLALGITRQTLQQVNTADQLFQRTHTQLRQPFTGFLRDKAEEVHGHFHGALEMLFPQIVILCGHTGRTVIQVADPQVFATQRHHRSSTEAKALRAQNRGFHHVQTSLDAAVGLQANLASQIIGAQRLLGFRQAQLPGGASVAD